MPDEGAWRLRPRALTLTIWARLLLADLFIHGIGGAKYDRISDMIMADYYGVAAPHMACVSATLRLDLPVRPTAISDVARLRQSVRDLRYNPQRHVELDGDSRSLVALRERAVGRSNDLRRSAPHDRAARREAFEEIRQHNAAILSTHPDATAGSHAALAGAEADLAENEIALGREYFFGLHDRSALERLLEALPSAGESGV